MYIGLISDTHGVFDPQFRSFLEPVDQIWHAGDFGGGMELAKEIGTFIAAMQEYKDAIDSGDAARLRELLQKGKELKEKVDGK